MSDSKISLSLGAKRKAPPSSTNGHKRPRATLNEDDDDGVELGRVEKVSHFDKSAGGAVDESRKKEEAGPLIIPRISNRDWKEAANKRKRQKSGLPGDAPGQDANMAQKMRDVEAADQAKKPKFGLNTFKNARENGDEEGQANGDTPEQAESSARAEDAQEETPRQKTDDELAMDALLGKTTTDKSLTIAHVEDTMTEGDAFQHDYTEAPELPSLDDYARVPVEQFGAAMLRGMGWKDGEGIGSQKGKKLVKDTGKLPERRANLLGIGAKEDKSLASEMGAWGRAAKGGKEVKIYNPILLRDKKTGEMFTEEELQKKREKDERAKYEEEFERKEREKRRKDGDTRDRRRERDRDHDESRRSDKHRDRRRHDEDDESEEEYRRRKEKERRRRKEREMDERDDDHDRELPRRHRDRDDRYRDSDRDGRRDRSRDRDRRR
ncbi:Pre-mRNA-splicing factor spp2 [Fulvia fulva]|uniref:Pre-mRNA-splicing factor n=1 Tax=Passalora fulva TaxID=5499 RepID=A0A9Q8LEA7_PASFU|nr:Pre-mRNA-splicing factor spp2 [Fulvia fulva]KAK4615960.1 Pre-mRNA-splicing factor spp2 [Fulvia fulva]KAK4617238.1 Pre-mRNA-splicing factor spp2 [Fulvia fulva]UJO15951.1 Pre-mRNA-splicing factor spp2 [Fulvia fulva]WPV19280.1 Pre-mRNA-splicing factor spp2 [Fulvia fulva]WPV33900.1 Pre-mRNA-splicing factor spp2 [Fulvia fulva]